MFPEQDDTLDVEELYLLYADFEGALNASTASSCANPKLGELLAKNNILLTKHQFSRWLLKGMRESERERKIYQWRLGFRRWMQERIEEGCARRKEIFLYGFPPEIEAAAHVIVQLMDASED